MWMNGLQLQPANLWKMTTFRAALMFVLFESSVQTGPSPVFGPFRSEKDGCFQENSAPNLQENHYIPSGELTVCNGKSPFLMGKSTISMAIFNCYVSSPEGIITIALTSFFLDNDVFLHCLARSRPSTLFMKRQMYHLVLE